MKPILIFILVTFFVSGMFAQVPESINYQAIARDASNNPIAGARIGVRFQILQGHSRGVSVYTETHYATTNSLGLFNLAIGTGTPISGAFANLDWDNSPYFLELAIDPSGGTDFQIVGSSEMHSVPYALRASCKCSIIIDGDSDTWVETNPGRGDLDEIHMSLGLSPGAMPGVTGPTVLKLRRNNPISNSTMLELIDGVGSHNTFIGESAGNGSTGADNTAIGYKAFQNHGNGNKNTAFGVNAMYLNIGGSDNVAIGHSAMYNNGTGFLGSNARHNTAVGASALYKNIDGRQNTAIGNNSLYESIHGDYNTAIGVNSLGRNTLGKYNTASGVASLYSNKANDRSTAIGYGAMESADDNTNTIGRATFNTAIGFRALQGSITSANNTGRWNTALGDQALYANETGDQNTAIGTSTLISNTTGSCNTALGSDADVSAPNLTNATAIGCGAIATESNQIRLGNTSINAVLPGNDNVTTLGDNNSRWKEVWAQNGTIQTSDHRLKSAILNTTYGLDEIMVLRPVRYHWKDSPDDKAMLGFIAQEVEAIIPEVVLAPKTEAEYYAMKYEGLIPVLTKAIQEQQAMIAQLSRIVEQQNFEIENLKKEYLLMSGKD